MHMRRVSLRPAARVFGPVMDRPMVPWRTPCAFGAMRLGEHPIREGRETPRKRLDVSGPPRPDRERRAATTPQSAEIVAPGKSIGDDFYRAGVGRLGGTRRGVAVQPVADGSGL
jgi:hypothetical protein